jgi:peptide/nickel transport system permease protein
MSNPFTPIPSEDPDKLNAEHKLGIEEPVFGADESSVEKAENAIELKEVEGLSQGRIVFRRFVRHRGAMISLIVLIATILLAFSSAGIDALGIVIPGWWKWDYVQISDTVNGGAPTLSLLPQWLGGTGIAWGEHPFGQDEIGHDTFAQVMRGTQQSLMIVFVIGIVSTVLGVVIGGVSGFFAGRVDQVLMRFTDVIIIIPVIVIAAVLGRTFSGSGSFVLALVLGLVFWTGLARLVRGDVLSLREREFVDAARVAGASSSRIIFRHILPNTVGIVIVNATLLMSGAILTEAAISFLGFGVQFPDVSLGKLIFDYQTAYNTRPWLFWWPGLFIIIIALTINFIGDGLRDAFDPRQKRALNAAARRARAAARPAAKAAAKAGRQ